MNQANTPRAQTLRKEMDTFVTWGCVLGIALPVSLALLFDIIRVFVFDKPNIFFGLLYLIFFATIGISGFGSYYVSSWITNHPDRTRTARVLLYILGAGTAILMGVTVVCSGGVLRSPFTFFLLYLPAIVGIAFTPTSDNVIKSPGVLMICLLCGIMMLGGVLFSFEPPGFADFQGSCAHKIGYLTTSGIQLLSIILVVRKKATAN